MKSCLSLIHELINFCLLLTINHMACELCLHILLVYIDSRALTMLSFYHLLLTGSVSWHHKMHVKESFYVNFFTLSNVLSVL